MISAVLLLIFLSAFSVWYGNFLSRTYPVANPRIFNLLILFHFLMAFVYYLYATFNLSDSRQYYFVVQNYLHGTGWFDYYGVSTAFIHFIAFPFIIFANFSYEAMMLLFAWFGLLGFFFFYIVLKERLRYPHKLLGYDLLILILFLPNLHFWSGSLGKGSLIFLGFGLFFFALNNLQNRWFYGIIGATIIYHVRPHILFIVLIASAWGFVFSSRGISFSLRLLVIMISIGAFYYIKEDVLALTGIDEENILENATTLDTRAKELMKANSGVDISSYSLPFKLFTFWFRPLFIDAPGILGLIVSFENLFYLIVFSKILKPGFFEFVRKSDHVVKASAVTFLGVSFALAQISGNLGIAMRQKSQVMILLMFIILKFMDENKYSKDLMKVRNGKIKKNRAEAMRLRQDVVQKSKPV
jgi:hypothetical protein